ncbi:MAG: carbon-nitrogen hydrolase family protein [Kiritimatiellae bacterium]|nr:carbon-nitrogen hydrolase family protein [Kiritimatiellia bacterium]
MADTNAWSTWSPRPVLEPAFAREEHGGPSGEPALVISANGNPAICGCWRTPLSGLASERRYRVEAVFQTEGVPVPGHSVRAVLAEPKGDTEIGGFYDQLDYQGHEQGWIRMGQTLDVTDKTPALTLNLFLAWTPEGRIRWSGVRIRDITDAPRPERKAHLAAINGGLDLAGFLGRLDELGEKGVDLALLSETINPAPEPLPGGPWYEAFAEKARAHQMYVAVSLKESAGDLIHNTGVLIDRAGALVGKYRKTHPAPGEGIFSGNTPGDTYPVFETDFAKVGFLICYDLHFPEPARIYALKGAELLLNPNAGDGREGGVLWESVARMRAVDNQVHVLASIRGRHNSCVVNPKGEILSMAEQRPGAVASAVCDFNDSVVNFTGRPLRRRYDLFRRADTYGPLARHLFDGA